MARLVEAAAEADFPAEIVGVLSDQPEATGLRFAESRGLPAIAIARSDHDTRAAHEAAIASEIERLGADIVCLAGYMRLLSADFVARFEGRMINVHPSLLPAFKGLDTHARAIEAGCRIHGCTVHFVTAAMDDGPIVAQAAVPVLSGDTAALLSARVLKAEHELYPLALRLVAEGRARVEDGRVVFASLAEGERDGTARLYSPSSWAGEVDLEALARVTP